MKRYAYPLVALVAALSLTGAMGCAKKAGDASEHGAKNDAFGRLTIDELETKMKESKEGKLSLFIFDNNGKSVYEKGHVPGAKWLDSDNVQASDLPADKEATLVFYCANDH